MTNKQMINQVHEIAINNILQRLETLERRSPNFDTNKWHDSIEKRLEALEAKGQKVDMFLPLCQCGQDITRGHKCEYFPAPKEETTSTNEVIVTGITCTNCGKSIEINKAHKCKEETTLPHHRKADR